MEGSFDQQRVEGADSSHIQSAVYIVGQFSFWLASYRTDITKLQTEKQQEDGWQVASSIQTVWPFSCNSSYNSFKKFAELAAILNKIT